MKIAFFGTPYFALHSLQSLIHDDHHIVAVITSEDKPKGRGLKLNASEIKVFAQNKNIPLFQPKNLKSKSFNKKLSDLNADLFVVVAFRMLPETIWKIPNKGTINLHTSLLPNYRGAAPMNWVIINGESTTGATTFFINNKIDCGNIILQKEVKIPTTFNVGNLHDKLMHTGADLLLKTINSIEKGNIIPFKQREENNLKSAPKLTKKLCKINWNKKIKIINNFIKGLSPYPVAWTNLICDDVIKNLKIYSATAHKKKHSNKIGKVELTNKTLHIWALDGFLDIIELQVSGKKRMDVKSFLNGLNLSRNYKVN